MNRTSAALNIWLKYRHNEIHIQQSTAGYTRVYHERNASPCPYTTKPKRWLYTSSVFKIHLKKQVFNFVTSSAVLAGDHVEIRLYDFESNIGKTSESTVNVEKVLSYTVLSLKKSCFCHYLMIDDKRYRGVKPSFVR